MSVLTLADLVHKKACFPLFFGEFGVSSCLIHLIFALQTVDINLNIICATEVYQFYVLLFYNTTQGRNVVCGFQDASPRHQN